MYIAWATFAYAWITICIHTYIHATAYCALTHVHIKTYTHTHTHTHRHTQTHIHTQTNKQTVCKYQSKRLTQNLYSYLLLENKFIPKMFIFVSNFQRANFRFVKISPSVQIGPIFARLDRGFLKVLISIIEKIHFWVNLLWI